MRVIERATRAELRALGVALASSALARVAIDLARRLDADPGDRAATMLSHELRMVTTELHRRSGKDIGSELETFLASLSNPALRGPGD